MIMEELKSMRDINFIGLIRERNDRPEAKVESFNNGDIIRHFKYDLCSKSDRDNKKFLYEFITASEHTETGKTMVIYRALSDGKIYCRPSDSFLSEVDKDRYRNALQNYRFEKVNM